MQQITILSSSLLDLLLIELLTIIFFSYWLMNWNSWIKIFVTWWVKGTLWINLIKIHEGSINLTHNFPREKFKTQQNSDTCVHIQVKHISHSLKTINNFAIK